MKRICLILSMSLLFLSQANAGSFGNLPTYSDLIPDLSLTINGLSSLYEGGTIDNDAIMGEIRNLEIQCQARLETLKKDFIAKMKTEYGTDITLIEYSCHSGVVNEGDAATSTTIVTRVNFTFITK